MSRRTFLALAAVLWLTLTLFVAPPHVHAGSPPLAGDEDAVGVALQNSQTITNTQPVTPTVPGQTTGNEDTSQEEQDTVPPSDLTQALGTLGIFAAVMAVLAVGTEVIVDTIKLAIGMKSKPTAMESMEKLEALLPGKLKEFGASADAQKQVEGYLKGLRVVMEDVETVQKSIQGFREGNVKQALQTLYTLVPQDLQKQIEQGQEAAADYAIQFLEGKVDLNQTEKDHIRDLITEKFTDMSTDDVDALRDDLKKRLDNLVDGVDNLANTVATQVRPWLEQALQRLGERDPMVVIQEAEDTILKELPLTKRQREQVSAWLKSAVSGLDITAQTDLNNYLCSLTNLLQEVNQQRYELQSPARKLWRCLRKIQFLGIGKLFESIERAWNRLLGRTPDDNKLDKPRESVPTLTLTDAAQVVMEQETRHRDEEASRLRWLRVVSVFAGIWLASYLKLNAGELLSAKVIPGELVTKLGQTVGEVSRINLSIDLWPLSAIVDYIKNLELGYILSGLGAAAGSTFWHDQLDKLQAAKKASEQLDQLRAQVREMQGGETQ